MAYIPDEAIDRMYGELSSGARDLYTFLCRCRNQKSGRCCPSVSTTQNALKLSRARVFALRKELIDRDWVRFDGNNAIWIYGFDSEDNRPEVETGGMIYVISDGAGRYKIGQTTNLTHRLATLSTSMPVDPIVVISYHAANARTEEQLIHRQFAGKQLKREWYALSDDDLAWMNTRSLENKTTTIQNTEDTASLENETGDDVSIGDSASLKNETDNGEAADVIQFSPPSLKNKTIDESQKQDGPSKKQDPASQKQDSHIRNNQQIEPANRTSKEEQDMSSAIAPAVREVFTYWQNCLNHSQAKLTPKRKKLTEARLKERYTVEQLKSAIDGCRASPWHMGQNPNGTVWDDLALICRDGEHVEMFIAKAGLNGTQTNKTISRRTTEEYGIRDAKLL